MLHIGDNAAESMVRQKLKILIKLESRSRSIIIRFKTKKHEAFHSLTLAVFLKAVYNLGNVIRLCA